MTTADSGFTLIEALVAMAVLAVAATGFIRATEGHLDLITRLEARAAGSWAADNALSEARLGLTPTAGPLLGQSWRTTVTAGTSEDPDVAPLTVSAAAGGTRVTLRGFRDIGAGAPVTRP